ncbi:SPOR domain-containing protein [Paenibacillus sp. IHBB 10380]|uniref:SPOR domain-containing protein n=1 Tax=Paenibacillus sp. IHBB 10380 TaxID=1566358 RepID=UPI0006964543|nr:SPOR domain-containing protein [Paenibacillus sp. IHBB 10380]
MNKAKMTFRFDEGKRLPDLYEDRELELIQGKEQFSNEAPKKHTSSHITVLPESMEGWGDPFSKRDNWEEMLTHGNLEQLNDSKEEKSDTLYESNSLYESNFQPSEVEKESSNKEYYGIHRPRRPTSLWKVFGTVTAAVVTGGLFGFVVLSFFDMGNIMEQDARPVSTQQSEIISSPDQAGEAEQMMVVKADVEPQTYYMLQYGVFSSVDRVEQAKKELLGIGLAAGNDPDQENRVYAGVSLDREQAKLLSNQLKTQGVELYVREIQLPSATELAFSGDSESVSRYYSVSSALISSLSHISATRLGIERPTALSSDETNELTKLHQQWIESMKTLQSGITPEGNVIGKQMEQSMNSALSSVTEYNKNSSKGHLWEIQSNMMQYIMGQKQLIDMIKTS